MVKNMGPVFAIDLALDAGTGTRAARLHQALRGAILDGRLAPGTALPSTRRAAAALGLARNTVVTAYDLLVAEGYVEPRRGAKAIVVELAPRRVTARRTHGGRPRAEWPLQPGPFMPPEAPRPLPPRSFRLGVPEHRLFP